MTQRTRTECPSPFVGAQTKIDVPCFCLFTHTFCLAQALTTGTGRTCCAIARVSSILGSLQDLLRTIHGEELGTVAEHPRRMKWPLKKNCGRMDG